MKKNMYKQPTTEVVAVETDYLMLNPVSFGSGADPNSPPPAHAPSHGTVIP